MFCGESHGKSFALSQLIKASYIIDNVPVVFYSCVPHEGPRWPSAALKIKVNTISWSHGLRYLTTYSAILAEDWWQYLGLENRCLTSFSMVKLFNHINKIFVTCSRFLIFQFNIDSFILGIVDIFKSIFYLKIHVFFFVV